MAIGPVRDGGAIGRAGAAQYAHVPMDFHTVMRNITLTGDVAPAPAYIEELPPDVLDGRLHPGRMFDSSTSLYEVPDRYAPSPTTALKVLIQP